MMKKIIIYTTTHCPWCHATKEFLKKNGYEYEERKVEENPAWAKELIEKSGQLGVPVIDIEGRIIIGFSPAEIIDALQE